MFIRIVNLKFTSEIEADAMHAYAEPELINKLPGILSIFSWEPIYILLIKSKWLIN